MKSRFAYLIIILVTLIVGYLIEPALFPNAKLIARNATPKEEFIEIEIEQPKPKPVAVTKPQEVTPEEPLPDEEPYEDGVEDDEEEDLDGAEIKKMKRAIGEDAGRRPVQEERLVGKTTVTDWKNPKLLHRKFAMRLRSLLKSTERDKVLELIKKPENRLMIAQWEVLNKANLDDLSNLMRDKAAVESLTPLLNDLRWVSSFAYDGELTRSDVALAMIYDMRKADPNMDKDVVDEGSKVMPGVKRRIAAAVAVEFTRNGWFGEGRTLSKAELDKLQQDGGVTVLPSHSKNKKDADKKDLFRRSRARYQYFAQSWDDGLLNSSFGTMPDWLMHFPCGWNADSNGDSGFGTPGTMRWLRDNVSARPGNYTGTAYQVEYRPLNMFGDSIFTPPYYEPYASLYPNNFAKEVRDVGGVCGSLSKYGASTANANGIPAITMGEPGHCAYAVYANGKWNPANSISEKRGPHWSCWGLYTWSAFQMMTDMYEDGQRTRDAQMVCTLANVLASNKNPVNALKLYEMAVTMQPLYSPVWSYYLETAAKSLSKRPAKYLGVNDFICSSVAPLHPEMCARYLTETIYPTLLTTLRTPKQKMVAFRSYFENLNVNEKAEWDMEKLLNMQCDSLGKAIPPKLELFSIIAENVRRRPEFGLALSWAVRRAYMENKSTGDKVRGMVDKVLQDIADSDDEKNVQLRRLLNASVVRAAEEMGRLGISDPSVRMNQRDRDYYISVANKYSKDYMAASDSEPPMPSFAPPAGNLISEGGLVMLDDYCPQQDSIVRHASALTTDGGHILSEKGKHRTVTVELPKKATLGGVVIVPTNGCSQYREWAIQISTDGKTWTQLTKLPDSLDKPYVTIEINRSNPTAKFLRIDSGAEQNLGIDFKAILVYDNKKAK